MDLRTEPIRAPSLSQCVSLSQPTFVVLDFKYLKICLNTGSIPRPKQPDPEQRQTELLVSGAHQGGQVHPDRQNIIRVGVYVHSQGKLHVWRLNIVNAGAVDCFYDGPDLREGLVQREAGDLPKNNG